MSKEATMKDGDVVINERGGRQAYISARFDLIDPEALRLLAQCLGRGARVRGVGNWRLLDIEDNIGHAANHLNEWRAGDRSEMHLVHAMARTMFAVCQAIEAGEQATQYSHPEDEKEIARNG